MLMIVLAPLLMCHSVWQALRAKSLRLGLQRLGLAYPQRDDQPIWIHAASVGEVNAVIPLIKKLRIRYPQINIIITTITPTGAANASNKLPHDIQHVFLPIDQTWSVSRFLKALNPRVALIMETEIWPQLYHHCAKQNIPLMVINGRLSERTLNTMAWIRRIYTTTLSTVGRVLARSETDKEHFIALGVAPEKIKTLGNIKYAQCDETKIPTKRSITQRPYVLAASTHDDEELRFLRIWQSIDTHDHLLIIAPRHPQRIREILAQLNPLCGNIAIRSQNDLITEDTQVYIADTLGELELFIQGAELVFMGGSLIPRGGQNILEPARFGKAILFGSHMQNFQDEAHLFLDQQAAIQCSNEQQLAEQISQLLEDKEKCQRMGINALRIIQEQQQVLDAYIEEVADYCDLPLETNEV
jgi:3-deoxy-D-manno-octulosonic-acid transferase